MFLILFSLVCFFNEGILLKKYCWRKKRRWNNALLLFSHHILVNPMIKNLIPVKRAIEHSNIFSSGSFTFSLKRNKVKVRFEQKHTSKITWDPFYLMILFYFLLINYSLLRVDYAEFDDDIPQQLEYRTLDILVLYKSLYRFVLDSLMKY